MTVKAGSNGFNWLVNRDGFQAGDATLRPTCRDAERSLTILSVMLRVGELLAQRKSADEIERDIDAGFTDGRFSSPHKTGVAYMLQGDVPLDSAVQAIGIGRGAIGDRFDLPFVYAPNSRATRTSCISVLAKEAKDLIR